MQALLENNKPTDEFILQFQKLSFSDFVCDYDVETEDMSTLTAEQRKQVAAVKKQLRNDYDNRMRGKNLQLYYMDYLINRNPVKKKSVSTMTSVVAIANTEPIKCLKV